MRVQVTRTLSKSREFLRLTKLPGLHGLVICSMVLVSCQKVKFSTPPLAREVALVSPTPTPSPSPKPSATPWIPKVTQAQTPPPIAIVTPAPIVQDPIVKLNLLRFEADSWFKVCFWVTVDGVPQEKAFLGCNKGGQLIGGTKSIELDLSRPVVPGATPKPVCTQLGLKAAVFKNTQNCVAPDDCKDETYAKEPSYVRMTNMAAGPGLTPPMHPFITRTLGDGSVLDSRILMTPELERAEADWKQAKTPASTRVVRIFFEDQTDDSFAKAMAQNTDWKSIGMDFNDIVFDFEVPTDVAFGFDLTPNRCSK